MEVPLEIEELRKVSDLLRMKVFTSHSILAIAIHIEFVAWLAFVFLLLWPDLQLLESMCKGTLRTKSTLVAQLPILT